jgi:predicted deacetylase
VVTLDKRGTVIERHQLHPRGQASIIIDLFDLSPDASDNVIGVKRAIHYYDRGNYVVLVIAPSLAESWNVAHVNLCDILHEYWDAV